MARFTIPPFTRLLLVVLTFFTLSMAVFRYYLFIHAIHNQQTTSIEQQSDRYLQRRDIPKLYEVNITSLTKKDGELEEKVPDTDNSDQNQNQNQDQLSKSEAKSIQRVYQQSYSTSQSKKSKDYIKFNSIALPFLVMVPGIGVLRYPWVIVTSSFTEETLLNFIITGGILLFSGKYLEHMWGSTEMAKFILIQTLVPNIGTLLFTFMFKTYDPLCQLGTCHDKHEDSKDAHFQDQPVAVTQPTSTIDGDREQNPEQFTDKTQDGTVKTKRDDTPHDQKKEDLEKKPTIKAKSLLSAIVSPGVDRWVIINGGSAFVSGFLVAFKQLVPEHTVALFQGAIRFKVARIPVVYFIAIVLGLFIEKWTKHCALALWGFFTSWIYLRFYRKQNVEPISPFAASNLGASFAENTSRLESRSVYNGASRSVSDLNIAGESSQDASTSSGSNNKPITNSIQPQQAPHQIRGDASDYFSFAQFFPEPISLLVEKIERSIMNLLYTIKVCTPFTPQEIEMANIRTQMRISGAGGGSGYVSINPYDYSRFSHADSQLSSSTGNNAVGGSRNMNNLTSNTRLERSNSMRAEAERRRALALKAFDLNHKKSSSSMSSSSSKNESK